LAPGGGTEKIVDMVQRAVPPPIPAVLDAARTHGLGEHIRGYTAYYKTSDKRSQGNGKGVLMFVALMVAAALPLTVGVLVAWWLGVVLVAAYAVGLTVWLRQSHDHVHEFRGGLVARTKSGVVPLRWDDVTCVYQGVSQIYVNGVYGGTNHGYRLRMRDGRYVHFNGSVNDRARTRASPTRTNWAKPSCGRSHRDTSRRRWTP
jgi:hypothetical protein